ncbi:MAG: hypothetical protein OIF35_03715, partial [Cellvibrionaceae bacterium]|nr:hypothetical protein [Cellvibrionaceae bacterium]
MLTLVLGLSACGGSADDGPERVITGLPWQIETFEDGSSQVFDIRLGHTTLEQAQQLLGSDTESAIIIDQQNKASMELYASHYKAGPLSGKLVLLVDITPTQMAQMIQNLEQGDYMASGARKLFPT